MYKVNFMANQTIAAADIHAIGDNIAEAEYPTFSDGVTYGVDALNGITAQMVTAGVKRGAGNNCVVSLNGTTVFISSGTVFFDCGAVMTIDSDGISVDLEDSSQTNYVYLFFDAALNAAGAKCTVVQPSGTDCVLLAEITGTSITQNAERFCKSRIFDAPNTPLVIYNSIAGDSANDVSETISVPNLSQYTLMRITCPKGYLGDSSDNTHKWIVDISNPNDVRGVFFVGTRVEYIDGNYISLLYRFSSSGYYYTQSGVDIYLSFNNNAIEISTQKGNTKWTENSIKIELFAGEVE